MESDTRPVNVAPLAAHPPRKFAMPAGAWDCHNHVIGAPPAYPYVDEMVYIPYAVTPAQFIGMLDAAGLRNGVAVQTSVHGTDNRYLLEGLRQFPGRLAGVAVIDRRTSASELAALKAAGVVGIRLWEGGGGVGMTDLEYLGDLCADLGWHVQVCVVGERWIELTPGLRKLRVPFVMDHMGWFTVGETPAGKGFQGILALLRDAGAWVKLSGAFRLSARGAPYHDIVPFLEQLVAVAPDRAVYGSDWPHVGIADVAGMPQVGDLLDLLATAVPDATTLRRILVDNPARLYGAGLRA